MIIKFTCDRCKIEIEGHPFNEFEEDLCEKCFLEQKIELLEDDIERTEEWLKDCYLRDLRKDKIRLREYKKKLKELN